MTETIAFGRVLRELRRNRGMSQDKLADVTDTHRTFISQLERGLRNPSLRTITCMAKALGISRRDLMGLVDDEEARLAADDDRACARPAQRASTGRIRGRGGKA